jgi:hypothetical protein
MEQVKAFPTAADNGHSENQDGMELRDYFAAKAIQTVFEMVKHDYDRELSEGYGFGDEEDYDEIAERAYAMADAMMEARGI